MNLRIYLIGLMGSGKTTAGKALAKKLSFSFYDLDDLIENQIGMSISDYFAHSGEEKFRMIEKECLHETFLFNQAVISTGGGTPCFFDNMEQINRNGLSFYLKANVNLLFNRLKEAKVTRPLISNLTEEQLVENLTVLLKKREIYYSKAKYSVKAVEPLNEMLELIKRS
jgi:shikimate kinase